MLSTALVALDSTIIATAVLTIVDDLGGFAQFPWLFSIYLLAQAVTVPVYGKLADIFGRKPVMLWGIAIFTLGSVLCRAATSMVALIVFRAIQGFGAGAVQPMALTIAGDIYSVPERRGPSPLGDTSHGRTASRLHRDCRGGRRIDLGKRVAARE